MSHTINKVVRLDDGRFITRKLVASDPCDLIAAAPEEVWECSDGRRIVAKDMELKHLMNCIFFMEGEATKKLARLGYGEPANETEAAAFKKVFSETVRPQYAKFKEELEIRLGKRERAAKPSELPSRCFNFE